MRYLTLAELQEQYGGILPPDACLRADDQPEPNTPPRPGRAPLPRSSGKGRVNPVVRKVTGYRRFFDALPTLDPMPSPGAVAIWCWLWTCERKGRARCSVRKLAERFGAGRDTIRRRLAELVSARLIRRVRRGRFGKCASVYRVRPTPEPARE